MHHGGQLQPVLMRPPPQLFVKTWGGGGLGGGEFGGGGGSAGGWMDGCMERKHFGGPHPEDTGHEAQTEGP